LRRYLYLTAAVTGAAIMIVEILGAKMLSPYVGLSHFVWTAQIAVTLVALSCGYYIGGRLADRTQRLSSLYWAILGAAAYLAITVLICKPVAYWCLDFRLAIGSLLASTILFFLPLALLAMTGPFLVRVITSSLTGLGGNVGRLISIGTVGSFVGTLLIGYLLIPFFPNSLTMYITSLALLLICAGYFAIFRRQTAALAVVGIVGVSAWFGARHASKTDYQRFVEKYFGNSHFGQIQVVDRSDGSVRYYLNDFLVQNTYDPARKQSVSQFTYLLSGLARAYVTNINDVLCIGLGVGIVPMDFATQGARVDVAEINPAIVPVGVKFFDLDTNKLHITIDDARHFLNRCDKKYDAVILDAFLGDSSPSHLMTREAFSSIRRALRPGGALVINSFGNLEPGHDFFVASLNKTLKSVFANVHLHTGATDGGMFFVASDRSPLQFVRRPDLQSIHPAVVEDAADSFNHVVDTIPEDGMVLTDDYNPAEFYDAKNREEIRHSLAMRAKDL
jgi:spermidine synthase